MIGALGAGQSPTTSTQEVRVLMSEGNWDRLAELFAQASVLPKGERDAFIVEQCSDDPALAVELRERSRTVLACSMASLRGTTTSMSALPIRAEGGWAHGLSSASWVEAAWGPSTGPSGPTVSSTNKSR